MAPNPKRPLNHWSTLPKKRGLYVRDWRGTRVIPESDRRLTIDLWEPLPPGDPLGPRLAALYGVDIRDVVFGDEPGYRERPGDVHLHPRWDGDYSLPSGA